MVEGHSIRKQKENAQQIRNVPNRIGICSLMSKGLDAKLEFIKAEARVFHQTHNNALVITLMIANIKSSQGVNGWRKLDRYVVFSRLFKDGFGVEPTKKQFHSLSEIWRRESIS